MVITTLRLSHHDLQKHNLQPFKSAPYQIAFVTWCNVHFFKGGVYFLLDKMLFTRKYKGVIKYGKKYRKKQRLSFHKKKDNGATGKMEEAVSR